MSEPDPRRLRDLGEKLDEIRRQEEQRKVQPPPTSAEVAFRFATELFAATIVGGAMGWGLDWLFGTRPVLTVVMFLFGAAAGIRNVIRTSKELNARIAAAAAKDKKES